MAKFVRASQLIRQFKQSAAPTVAQGLTVDDIWVDTDDHATYVCTSVSPVTFTAIGGGGGGSPGGSNTQVQFNDASAFGGDAGLTYNKATDTLTAGTFSGPLTGNVTGNCTGSSGSCTGNAATVTTNANLTGVITSTGNATVFASMTSNNVLLGNGTATPQVVAPGSNGNVLTSNGTTWTSAAGAGAPAESAVTFTDITTNNSSTTKHGYLAKLDNNAAHYMDGTGAWSTPAGGGGGATTLLKTNSSDFASGGAFVFTSGMSTTLTANKQYLIEAVLRFQLVTSDGSNSVGFAFCNAGFTADIICNGGECYTTDATPTTISRFYTNPGYGADMQPLSDVGDTSVHVAVITLLIETGSTPGTTNFGCNFSHADGGNVLAGSILRYTLLN